MIENDELFFDDDFPATKISIGGKYPHTPWKRPSDFMTRHPGYKVFRTYKNRAIEPTDINWFMYTYVTHKNIFHPKKH